MGGQRAGRWISILIATALLGIGAVASGVALADETQPRDPGGDGRVVDPPGDDPVVSVPDDGSGGGDGGTGGPGETPVTNPLDGDSGDDELDDGGGGLGGGGTGADLVPGVDLVLTKTDSPDPVTAGNSVTYTVTVTNNGDTGATNVVVTDLPPAEGGATSATSTQGMCSIGGGGITCNVGSMASGATVTITIVVFVFPNVPAGTVLSNTANASSDATEGDQSNNFDTETTTVVASADVFVSKDDNPVAVPTGTNLTYSIGVTNIGPSDAQAVTLTDAVPAGTTFVSFSAPAGWIATTPAVGGTGTVTATTTSLAAGDGQFFTLVVNVNAPSGSLIDNTATVAATTTDPDPANNTASAQTPVVGSADLSVTKTDTPDPVTAGNNLTYTITVANGGGDFANNVTLADTLPSGTTFVSLTSPAGWSCTTPAMGAGGTINCSNPSLAPAASAAFTLVVNVNASTPGGSTISNTASATSSTFDPNSANNSDTETTAVVAQADLSVTKTDSPDPVTAGSNLSYTINLNNAGPSDAQGVSMTDAVPAGTTFVSFAQNTGPAFTLTSPPVGGTGNVTASAATMAAGASATFTVVVKVDAGAADGSTVTNTASVSSSTTDPVPTNNSDTETSAVTTSADLAVTKTDSPDPVVAGTNLTYTITATNNGPSDTGGDVTVTDTLPAGTSLVSATPSLGSCIAGPPVTCDVGPMANGATVTITVVVHVESSVPEGSELANNASVSSGTADPNTEDNEATEATDVETSADVSLTKEAAPDPVTAGNDLTYTITATNNGPSDAQDVTVTDELPAGTTFVSATPSQGSCSGTTTVTCDLGALANGASATITLVVDVDVATPGGAVITNTATASSPEPEVSAATADPAQANNSASVSVTVLAAPKAPERAGAVGTVTAAVAVVAVPRFTG